MVAGQTNSELWGGQSTVDSNGVHGPRAASYLSRTTTAGSSHYHRPPAAPLDGVAGNNAVRGRVEPFSPEGVRSPRGTPTAVSRRHSPRPVEIRAMAVEQLHGVDEVPSSAPSTSPQRGLRRRPSLPTPALPPLDMRLIPTSPSTPMGSHYWPYKQDGARQEYGHHVISTQQAGDIVAGAYVPGRKSFSAPSQQPGSPLSPVRPTVPKPPAPRLATVTDDLALHIKKGTGDMSPATVIPMHGGPGSPVTAAPTPSASGAPTPNNVSPMPSTGPNSMNVSPVPPGAAQSGFIRQESSVSRGRRKSRVAPEMVDSNSRLTLELVDATKQGDAAMVVSILKDASDPQAVINGLHPVTQHTALHEAVISRNAELIETLISWGADSNGARSPKDAPLLYAVDVDKDAIDMVKILGENGADLNAMDADQNTVLHLACKGGNRAIVKYLLVKGANLYARNKDGLMPSQLATDRISKLFNSSRVGSECASTAREDLLSPEYGGQPMLTQQRHAPEIYSQHSAMEEVNRRASPLRGSQQEQWQPDLYPTRPPEGARFTQPQPPPGPPIFSGPQSAPQANGSWSYFQQQAHRREEQGSVEAGGVMKADYSFESNASEDSVVETPEVSLLDQAIETVKAAEAGDVGVPVAEVLEIQAAQTRPEGSRTLDLSAASNSFSHPHYRIPVPPRPPSQASSSVSNDWHSEYRHQPSRNYNSVRLERQSSLENGNPRHWQARKGNICSAQDSMQLHRPPLSVRTESQVGRPRGRAVMEEEPSTSAVESKENVPLGKREQKKKVHFAQADMDLIRKDWHDAVNGCVSCGEPDCSGECMPQSKLARVPSDAKSLFRDPETKATGSFVWTRGELLGEGAYGKVFAGLNQLTGELMAVKQLKLNDQDKSREYMRHLQALEREISLYRKMRHKHIVGYINMERDVASGSIYVFLEYVSGGSIHSMLERFGKFRELLVRKYTRQLLLGLEYLHGRKIIHRDVKGGNVLVDRDGVIKLADFGASKAFHDATLTDGCKSIRGSVFWMAPEVIKGDGYGRRADIWSVGCTVIEMYTASHPWPGMDNTWTAIFHIAKATSGPPIPEEASDLACDFLGRCFDLDPKNRPTATELLQHPFVAHIPDAVKDARPLDTSSNHSL